jgi:hypothetical protein
MSDPIGLSISGSSAETDAPTLEDLLAQVGDYFIILRGVEEALADDGVSEIEWRVTNAQRQSPLRLELTPYPRRHGTNIDQRVRQVKQFTSAGLTTLRAKAERPSYFPEPVLASAERIFTRVTNGLNQTRMEFGDDFAAVEINNPDAHVAVKNTNAVRKPKEKPYIELGSIEGSLLGVERDGHGRPILRMKIRLSGEVVKCIAKGAAETEIKRHEIGDIWSGQRLRIFGSIHYRALGQITQIEAEAVQFLRPSKELPSAADIIDRNFTGGLQSEQYLEKLRNGDFS